MARLILLQVVFQASYLLGVIIAPIETETQSIQKELNKLNTVPVTKVSS
jgi:hypothetical protein